MIREIVADSAHAVTIPLKVLSPLPRSDAAMTEADRIGALHVGAAAAALAKDAGEVCASDGDAT